MTKAEEIKTIETIYNGLPEGSYLKEILHGIVEYAQENITMDFAVPVLNYRQDYYNLREQVNEVETRHKAEIEELRKRIDYLEAENTNWAMQDGVRIARIDELTDELTAARAEIASLQRVIETQNQQIIQLKARLYDALMEGGSATK